MREWLFGTTGNRVLPEMGLQGSSPCHSASKCPGGGKADTIDSKSIAARRGGSNPSRDTNGWVQISLKRFNYAYHIWGCGEMADTPGSEPGTDKKVCEFNSHHPHHCFSWFLWYNNNDMHNNSGVVTVQNNVTVNAPVVEWQTQGT